MASILIFLKLEIVIFKNVKPTNTNIAIFFGLDRKTIGNYKNGCENKKKIYLALKEYFIRIQNGSEEK